MNPLFAFNLGVQEMLILLVIGVLLFGRKLPDVGRSLGKGIVEFKKGLRGLEDDIDTHQQAPQVTARNEHVTDAPRPPQRIATTAPKFEDNAANANANITTPPQA
jgi:sec-independent protein translocase protein TatA